MTHCYNFIDTNIDVQTQHHIGFLMKLVECFVGK